MPALTQKILHVCIAVHDLDAALHFYRDVLGFESVLDTDNASADGILLGLDRDIVSLKAHHVMTVCTPGQDATEINLVEFVNPATVSPDRPKSMNEAGLTRLALLVENVDDAFSRIASCRGVEIVSTPREILIRKSEKTHASRWFSFRDPFGVFITATQLTQPEG